MRIFLVQDFRDYVKRLCANFGNDFVALLFSVYFFVKGFALTLLGLNLLPFFKNHLHVSETQYQTFLLVASTPWAMKAWMGTISDLYPLWGYHKRSYMIIAAIFGSTAVLCLAAIPFTHDTARVATIFMFFFMIEVAFIDLLCEGKYAELMRKVPTGSSDSISWVWGCVMVGSLSGAVVVGLFTNSYHPQYVFWIGLPFAAQVLYPLLRGYMPEPFVAPAERKIQMDKLRNQRNLFILAFLMALGALGLAVVSLTSPDVAKLLYAVGTSTLLCILAFMWMPLLLAQCNLYLFLQEALYISIPGALDYWYTADETCVKDGPHFNLAYYLTYTQIVGALAGCLGIFIFQTVMRKWTFRSCFWVSTGIRLVASMFDIFLITRKNKALGIPDKVAYMFGDALIMTTASMLAGMPAVLLTAKVCPKGYESTTYALLAGFQNFGRTVSQSIGIYLMYFMGIRTDGACNFDNLPWLVFISHFLFPLATIPLTFVLLPRARVEEDIDLEFSQFPPLSRKDSDSSSDGEFDDEHSPEKRRKNKGDLEMARASAQSQKLLRNPEASNSSSSSHDGDKNRKNDDEEDSENSDADNVEVTRRMSHGGGSVRVTARGEAKFNVDFSESE